MGRHHSEEVFQDECHVVPDGCFQFLYTDLKNNIIKYPIYKEHI